MATSASSSTTPIPKPRQAWWVCIGAIVSIIAGWCIYVTHAPRLNIVAVGLGGHGQTWPLPSGTSSALGWDCALIIGGGLALWLGTTAARWVLWTPRSASPPRAGSLARASSVARLGRGATVVAIVANVVENLFLTVALNGTGSSPSVRQAWALDAAAAAATIEFTVLVPAVVVAVLGIATAIGRLVSAWGYGRLFAWREGRHDTALGRRVSARIHDDITTWPPEFIVPPMAVESEPPYPRREAAVPPSEAAGVRALKDVAQAQTTAPAGVTAATRVTADEQRWQRAFNVPSVKTEDLEKGEPITGFCLSGGGIRSASIAMGALKTLRPELLRSKYLVSVSGGGYTAGAFAHLLTDAGDPDSGTAQRPVHDPRRAYWPGTVELDYVRRHSSYLASTATDMLVALGVLARGLLATLAVLYAPAVALGVAAAWYYQNIPLAVLPSLRRQTPTGNAVGVVTAAPTGAGLTLPTHALVAVAVVAGLALAAWLVQIAIDSIAGELNSPWPRRLSRIMTQIALVTAIGAVGIPTLVWASGRTVALVNNDSGRIGVGGSVGSVLLTYLASLASIGWRKRKTIQKVAGVGGGKGAGSTRVAVPNALLQLLLVITAVGVLCISWLLLFGVAAVGAVTDLSVDNAAAPRSVAIGAVVVFLVLGGLLDESTLSLHPFYRRRLASAFAVRTVSREPGSARVAERFRAREQTKLSTYARPAEGVAFPEFIFAAAANLTGEECTPPGLNAVSYIMSADWVGGPDVGWVKTEHLEAACSNRLRRDLTVQAAVAISGAAFASAMGRFTRWYELVLAVSGARLGAWLPNPAFLDVMRTSPAHDNEYRVANWTTPGLPHVRRVTYLLRELFNIHPQADRLLQITDGGHYENLGLVELLRRRCTEIYCIDGGGDSPPTASGLAEAIALAEVELGVQITLAQPFAAEPGAGRALTPDAPLATLNAALSKEPVIAGTIRYPAASGLPSGHRTGVLYVARALLWPDMPYPLLSYAAQHPVFPHDSTGDQWFDDGQFTAYTHLGRELGYAVERAKKQRAKATSAAAGHDGERQPLPQRQRTR